MKFKLIYITILILLVYSIFFIKEINDKKFYKNLIEIFIAKEKVDYKENDKKEFINNCFLARQVYQLNFYLPYQSLKYGKLNGEKIYAMSIMQYNELIELIYDLQIEINITKKIDLYKMLAKYIVESSICNEIEHKTGEIIKLAGYTEEGFRHALYFYLYESNIVKGSKFYISELFENLNLTTEKIKEIFSDYKNVVKFDFANTYRLLKKYNYDFDWVLTAHHYSERRTDMWQDAGCKMIPNHFLSGRHPDLYLREYYQKINEIAQGIAIGQFYRISTFEEFINKCKNYNNNINKYVSVLKLKFKAEEKFQDLNLRYEKLKLEFEKYKTNNVKMLKQINEINERR